MMFYIQLLTQTEIHKRQKNIKSLSIRSTNSLSHLSNSKYYCKYQTSAFEAYKFQFFRTNNKHILVAVADALSSLDYFMTLVSEISRNDKSNHPANDKSNIKVRLPYDPKRNSKKSKFYYQQEFIHFLFCSMYYYHVFQLFQMF